MVVQFENLDIYMIICMPSRFSSFTSPQPNEHGTTGTFFFQELKKDNATHMFVFCLIS